MNHPCLYDHRMWRNVLTGLLVLVGSACALAQYADLAQTDWHEGTVPAPPSYSTQNLIDIEMPRTSSVKMGIDPQTITVDLQTGIVRYVVVARGVSAVNASYEGIRCNTGEYRVYARQVPGHPWTANLNEQWHPLMRQSGVIVEHPLILARGGVCDGPTVRRTPQEVARALRTGNEDFHER